MRRSAVRNRRVMANSLPMTLRVYRKLSYAMVPLAPALIKRLRALNLRILLTSGTVTSAAIVAKRFPADIIHQYVPYDSPRYVARFLDHWQPSLALFIESDLWPNLILSSAARRLPMVLINGRMSH